MHMKNSHAEPLDFVAAGVEIILGKDLQTPKVEFCCYFEEDIIVLSSIQGTGIPVILVDHFHEAGVA